MAAPLAVEAGETLPQGAVLHETVQFTPPFKPSFATVAVNCFDEPASTVCGVEGVTETAMSGTAMLTEADFVESATEVALIVTVRLLVGGVLGAVYVVVSGDVVDDVGDTLPQEAALHETVHVTPLLPESFVRVAVIFAALPASTVLAEDEAEIVIGAFPPLQPAIKPRVANSMTNNFFILPPTRAWPKIAIS